MGTPGRVIFQWRAGGAQERMEEKGNKKMKKELIKRQKALAFYGD